MSEVEKMNEAMFERLGEIVFKAFNTREICNSSADEEKKNLQLLAAFTELRQMCEFYKPAEQQREEARRKHTMDFGRFHVTRSAIPGRCILTFSRKREHIPDDGTVVPGRIIVAEIFKSNVVSGKVVKAFVVKSFMAGEKPVVMFNGDSHVSMSKTEKIVYKMVKADLKETRRRRISRKRKAAAVSKSARVELENGGQA